MAGASPDAPNKIMKDKLYTFGQIGKRFNASSKEVSIWRTKLVKEKLIKGGRCAGVSLIPGDRYHRLGIPESLVKYFPNLPKEK